MKSFNLKLNQKIQRPVTKLYNVNTLIDTGAVIPTFSMPVYMLERAFHPEKLLENVSIGGFGEASYGDMYALKDFKVGDFNFSQLDIFIPYKPVTRYPFLLSATMFYGTDYDINTIKGEMMVNIPDTMSLDRTFEVKSLSGQLYAQVDGILLQDPIDCDIDFSQLELDYDYDYD